MLEPPTTSSANAVADACATLLGMQTMLRAVLLLCCTSLACSFVVPARPLLAPARIATKSLQPRIAARRPTTTLSAEVRSNELTNTRAVTLALACVVAAVVALDRVVMSVAILPMAEVYGFDESTKGLVAASFSAGYGVGILPAGALVAARPPALVLGAGLLAWSAAQAATPAAAALGLAPLFLARACMGAGEAAAIPSLQVVAAQNVGEAERSRFWGVLTACLSLGTIAAYALTPPLIARFGWEAAFYAYGGLGVVVALAWAAATASDDDVGAAADPVDWAELRASRPVWALACAHSASNFLLYFALAWLPTFFSYTFGASATASATASLAPFAAGAASCVVAGATADALAPRIGLTRTRKLVQGVAFLGPALALAALAVLEETGGLTEGVAEGLFVLTFACQAASGSGFGVGAQDIAKRQASAIYGLSTLPAVAAGAASQYATGVILDATHNDFSPVFALAATTQLLGLAAFWRWFEAERVFD